jgi:polar amino acid transport system substrate-binding protein
LVSEAREGIVLNTANEPPNSTDNLDGICDMVVKEAFRRIAMDVQIVRLPSERALLNANDGIEDGNYARVGKMISPLYPNLIQVPEPITRFEFTVFSKKHDFRTKGWESLRPYHVGIVTGWKILEKNIQNSMSLTSVNNAESLFSMLEADKIDIAAYDLQQGKFVMKQLKLKDIYAISPPLATQDMYIYLHKRHDAIVPKLTNALKQMKKDGTYRKIVEKALRGLL